MLLTHCPLLCLTTQPLLCSTSALSIQNGGKTQKGGHRRRQHERGLRGQTQKGEVAAPFCNDHGPPFVLVTCPLLFVSRSGLLFIKTKGDCVAKHKRGTSTQPKKTQKGSKHRRGRLTATTQKGAAWPNTKGGGRLEHKTSQASQPAGEHAVHANNVAFPGVRLLNSRHRWFNHACL